MGADGHFVCMRQATFESEYPKVDPEDAGLSQRALFGIEIVWAYNDTEGRGDASDYCAYGLAESYQYWKSQLDMVKTRGKDGVWEGKSIFGRKRVIAELKPVWEGIKALRFPAR